MNSPLQEYKGNVGSGSPRQPGSTNSNHIKKHSIWEPLDGATVANSTDDVENEDVNIIPLLPSHKRMFSSVGAVGSMGTLLEDPHPDTQLNTKTSSNSLNFTPPNQILTPSLNTTPSSDKPNRRKHHHKRSLSHAFFSFNDPTVTVNSAVSSKLSSNFAKTKDSKPAPPPTFERRAFSLRKFAFTGVELLLGAWLWLAGQRIESLSTTGMGYLITFDSISLISINLFDWYRTVSPTYKKPFGIRRLETLSLFTQVIYLVFAVTYLAKESVEHALISSTEDDYREYNEYDHKYGIPFPTHLILLSAILPYIANKYYHNHHSLALITGTLLYNAPKMSSFINNPYSCLISLFGSAMWLTAALIPPPHHHICDQVIAGCMAVCIGYLIYPSLITLSRILLQTAPTSTTIPILREALREIETHPLVKHLDLPRIFQITPGAASTTLLDDDASCVDLARNSSCSSSFSSATGISNAHSLGSSFVSLKVLVGKETSDVDIFNLTLSASQLIRAHFAAAGTQCTVDVRRDANNSPHLLHTTTTTAMPAAYPTYVIEHVEEEEPEGYKIPEWSLREYRNMAASTHAGENARVIYTNLSSTSYDSLNQALAPSQGKAATTECYKEGIMDIITREGIPHEKVCLLDPKAEQPIQPQDLETFSHFLFGGILGDDPPRDRTKELRKFGFPGRHLGPRQMSTDTALGTTKRVVVDNIPMEKMDFVDDPTIVFTPQESVDMPYRYLNDGTGKPLMAPGMLDHIRKDLDKGLDF
ncbi:hypothetical protein E3P84_01360 [Wallemia ichthyophaga]|nr:hypothetical protein E3P84_01360 [Wallemia ichthyophaga]TIB42247.1 hypothetical protein E3P83_01309 [Wallemia ichthyophaga]